MRCAHVRKCVHAHAHARVGVNVPVCASIPPLIADSSQDRFSWLNGLACDLVIPQPSHKRLLLDNFPEGLRRVCGGSAEGLRRVCGGSAE
eukprot:5902406-Alexandrium_andersonii.AAC.1